MPQVVILGAGPLGGELAFLLARRDIAASVALVDETGRVAAGKALDIMQSAPVEGFTTHVTGDTDLYLAARAPIVVLADTVATGEWQADATLPLLRRFAHAGDANIVICAGAGHAGLVDRAVREAKLPRAQVFGSAPEALASAVRAIAALEADRAGADVSLAVLGEPPHHTVIPWADATIGGFAADRVLDEPARRRLAARVPHLWPPGPLALASAAVLAVAGVLGHSRRSMSVFLAPDDALGVKAKTVAVPVVLGAGGVERVELPPLSGLDRVALDNAMLL